MNKRAISNFHKSQLGDNKKPFEKTREQELIEERERSDNNNNNQ